MKVALYGRVSTDGQKNNATIENQKRELEKYAKNNNLEVYRAYYDNGISGGMPIDERPYGSEMIKDAIDGKFSQIIILKSDRFGRDSADSLYIAKKISRHNIEIKAVYESIEDKFIFGIHLLVAEKERNDILLRSMLGKERAIQNGKWIGGLPPYAYKINPETKKLVLYDEKLLLGKYTEADVIKKIFNLCVYNKLSAEKISIILNKEGIPPYTPGKNKVSNNRVKASLWLGARVRNLIKEEVYKGTYTLGRRSSNKDLPKTIQVPAIVSSEEWDKAQEVLKSNIIKSTRNAKRPYLLSGIVFCGECKNKYHGLLSHTTYYYGCGRHRFRGNDNPTKCKNKHLNAKVVENEVWADIKKFILQPELIKSFLEERRKELGPTDYKQKLKEVEIKLSNLEKKKQRYAVILGIEDNPIMKDILAELEKIKNEEIALLDEKKFCEGILSQKNYEQNRLDEVESMLGKMIDKIESPTEKEKKEIISILVDKVIVYAPDEQTNERKIEIHYSFSKDGITKLTSIELL
jgi:site-specific DNA recombinase